MLGDPDLGTDPRFVDGAARSANRDAVNEKIEAIAELFSGENVPIKKIKSLQRFTDQARG